MVRKERLELSRLTALEPKSSASTNSATFANGAVMTPRGAHYNRVTLVRLEFDNGSAMGLAADQRCTG